MYDCVEFCHLKYFLAVAQEGSFTRAADRLHLSQPSLSTQIKQFEETVSAQLFVREKSGVMLTPAGNALMPFAEQVLRLREQAVDSVRAIHKGTAPPLALGFSHFTDQALMERTFACYRRLFPESEIRPTTHSTAQLLASLADGNLHAALVTLPIEMRDLVIQPVARERLLVCMRKDDPLASEVELTPRQIANRIRISFNPKHHPELYAHLNTTLARAGITMQVQHICTTPSDLQWMVKQGLGWSLVRESRQLDPELVARPIAGIELMVESAFVYRETGQASHLALLACELNNTARMQSNKTKFPTKIKPKSVAPLQPDSQMNLLV